MRFDVITLFPALFDALLDFGITGRAMDRGLFSFKAWNPRDFATDNYRTVDDRPYGGGPGMVMLAEPLDAAMDAIEAELKQAGAASHVIYFTPRGRPLDHPKVIELASRPALTLIAGRYEGVDERFLRRRVDEEISLGDFVLSGGEIPALAVMDAVIRQLPGSLNNAESALQESFVDGLLDAPCYTRPEVYRGEAVPDVLLSGNHKAIERWRLAQRLKQTAEIRPDLLDKREMNPAEMDLLDEETRRAWAARKGY
ncbi:MAG: tRNA (guanosine(37)-N1)-methyltransferase TrmD [Hydrogenophilaceae bacterium]|nr:tRNA (guanosine(37)-N1)-methyltransferase TrmD [Hydrogenophilaceae bacterium]